LGTELAHGLLKTHPNLQYFTEETKFHFYALRILSPLIQSIVLDIQVEGRENVPEHGALILAVNHVMFYDVVPVQIAIGKRPVFFMAKEEIFRFPLTNILFRALLAFPVQRGTGDAWAMDFAKQLLAKGQVVGIFPEGTRSYGRGLRRGKSGAARLAFDTGTPILPMAINGTQNLLTTFPRRTKVRIRIGTPLYPTPQEKVADLTDRLMLSIANMLPEEYHSRYISR
jgi:1-acyl-sn-glycerol-3-phosphate acyltransferase